MFSDAFDDFDLIDSHEDSWDEMPTEEEWEEMYLDLYENLCD